eukprot:7383706-Prymnesium_polylepis.1
MVRLPLAPVPPAAVNLSSAIWSVSLAIDSHSTSLPDVESPTAPADASGVSSLIDSKKLVACSRSAFCCVHGQHLVLGRPAGEIGMRARVGAAEADVFLRAPVLLALVLLALLL